MLDKELQTNTGSNEEGLRLLARIIARVYLCDVWDKTAGEAGEQLHTRDKMRGKYQGRHKNAKR